MMIFESDYLQRCFFVQKAAGIVCWRIGLKKKVFPKIKE